MTRTPQRRFSWLFALVALGCQGKQENKAPDPAPTATNAAPEATAPDGKPKGKRPARPVEEFPAPAAFELKPLAVGQWIRLSVEPKGEPPSQVFVRIVGKEGEAFLYEIETNNPTGTSVLQFLMEERSRRRFDKSAIRKLRVKAGDAPVQELAGPMVAMAFDTVEGYAGILGQPDFDKAERADMTVSAGAFKGCFVQNVERTTLGLVTLAKTFRHPAVPITGFVRSEGTLNGKPVVQELLEKHETGAKSAM